MTTKLIFDGITNTTHTVAVTVFSFFKATHTQREVLRKLSKITPFMTEDLNSRLKEALKTYIALAEERNELLHNPIGRSVENQIYIMLRKATPEPGALPYHARSITPTEIDDLSGRIRNLNLELRALEGAIRDARFKAPRAE
ncbi:MAG: hypothetical protein P4M05_02620 [Bradyrhizobium sp.]|nr:hypothetical protein [Bradyrhizobium sp.]